MVFAEILKKYTDNKAEAIVQPIQNESVETDIPVLTDVYQAEVEHQYALNDFVTAEYLKQLIASEQLQKEFKKAS